MATRAHRAPERHERAYGGAGANTTAGAVAGLVAALVMAVWSMGYAGLTGLGFFLPLKLIAAVFFGVEALVGEAGVLLTGVGIHLVTAMAYGAVFAWLLKRSAGIATGVMIGLLYGIGVLVVMTFVVLPLVNPVMRARVELIPFSWVVTHLLFGLTLGILTPVLRGRFA